MKKENVIKAVELRHEIHAHPELSCQESGTRARLIAFLHSNSDFDTVDMEKWFYAVKRSDHPTLPPIAFRCELDAVPVPETINIAYGADRADAAHKCGHDGHMAALCLLAMELTGAKLPRDVFLIFQHAEETGAGAREIAPEIPKLGIKEIYSWHNWPDLEYGTVHVKNGPVHCASTGMIISYTGAKCHASMPEEGKNPAFAVSEIVLALAELTQPAEYKGLVLATVIQMDVGERAFGTSAGEGKLLLTVRGEYQRECDALVGSIAQLAKWQAEKYGLSVDISYDDTFPETANTAECAEKVRRAAQAAGIPCRELEKPFRSSEDMGHLICAAGAGATFYVGDGDYAELHTTGYDFPDELIERAVPVLLSILRLND